MTAEEKKYTNRIAERMDALQKEMIIFMDNLRGKDEKLSYLDCLTTFFLLKIAQLDLDKENIQSPKNQS